MIKYVISYSLVNRRGDRTLRNNFFIMLKKKYAAPKNIAKLIIWIPNNEKNNILNPKCFFAKSKNLNSIIIWVTNDINNPTNRKPLFKAKTSKIKIKIINVNREENARVKVANVPVVSNFFFSRKSGMYFSVLSIILLHLIYKLHHLPLYEA